MMIRRGGSGGSGHIESFSQSEEHSPVTCLACSRLIVSRSNMKGSECPYCHNNVNKMLGVNLQNNDDNEEPPIAKPC